MDAATDTGERELDRRLEHYRSTAEQARPRAGYGRVARYATATASAFALAGGAEASVIYSGAQNLTISIQSSGFQTLQVDLDGAYGADVRFELLSSWSDFGTSGSHFSMSRGAADVFNLGLTNGAGVQLVGSGAARLSSGDTISAGRSFGVVGRLRSYRHDRTLTSSGSVFTQRVTSGPWPESGSGFVGVELKRGADVSYGWIRLRLENLSSNDVGGTAPDHLTVVDWAYQDVPNRAIAAGATVPEPSTLTLLAAGAVAVELFKKRGRRGESGDAARS